VSRALKNLIVIQNSLLFARACSQGNRAVRRPSMENFSGGIKGERAENGLRREAPAAAKRRFLPAVQRGGEGRGGLGAIRGGFLLLFWGSSPHLHHLRHHLGAVERLAGLFCLQHLPHHVPTGHPATTALPSLPGLILLSSHFWVPPSLLGLTTLARFAASTDKTEMPSGRLHVSGEFFDRILGDVHSDLEGGAVPQGGKLSGSIREPWISAM